MAVFDVSDPFNPRQVDKLTLPGAYSQAEWDHHAFLYGETSTGDPDPTVERCQLVERGPGGPCRGDGIRTLAEMEQPGYVTAPWLSVRIC